MTLLRSIQFPPVAPRFARLEAFSLLFLLVAASSACSPAKTDSSSDGGAKANDVALEGMWRVWPEDGSSFEVNIEGDRARIVRFGPGFEIGNPEVLNGGDPFLAKLTRVDAQTFSAQVASFELDNSPTAPKNWPTSVSYVDTTLKWDDGASRWITSEPKFGLSKQSATFDGKYAPAGACEQKFENHNNATLYVCEYPQDDEGCFSSGEKAFWPSTDCERLGYAFRSNDLGTFWYESETNNVTPGAHGQWGDGSGGEKIVSAAATATGGAAAGEHVDAGAGDNPQSGATCLVGKWEADVCKKVGVPMHTLSFMAGIGDYVMPDCAGVCTDPLDFRYTYDFQGNSVTLRYTGSSPIRCNGSLVTPDKPMTPDTFEFSCMGDTLITTTSSSMTYTRVKE
jgi:hypothetical protein